MVDEIMKRGSCTLLTKINNESLNNDTLIKMNQMEDTLLKQKCQSGKKPEAPKKQPDTKDGLSGNMHAAQCTAHGQGSPGEYVHAYLVSVGKLIDTVA